MKSYNWLLAALICSSIGIHAQMPDSAPRRFVEVDVGPNHRTLITQDDVLTGQEDGSREQARIVEIATGMNYWDGSGWVPTDATFDEVENGFEATHMQHQVRLAGNINVVDAVSVLTQDGKVLRSTPVGIGLYDAESGQSLIISTLTDSFGVLVSSNQIVYANAFDGLAASIVYTIQPSSFEQDVVITGELKPEDYGFPPETTRIQVFTEFYEAPAPDRIRRPLHVERERSVREKMASPDLVDEVLGFGEFVLATGRAGRTVGAARSRDDAVPVAKEFRVGERTFLVESVEYKAVAGRLTASNVPRRKRLSGGQDLEKLYASIPVPPDRKSASERIDDKTLTIAKAEVELPTGILIDYIAEVGPGLTVPTSFRADTTYLVKGPVVCNGATTIEGGAVFKYKYLTAPSVAYIKLNNALTCKTDKGRPAVFTAVDDNTVGDGLSGYSDSGYTGSINTNSYANPALWVAYLSSTSITNVHVRYAQEGIRIEGAASTATIGHSQFVKCVRGVVISGSGSGGSSGSGVTVTMNNSLMAEVEIPLSVHNPFSSYNVFNSTIDKVQAGTSGGGYLVVSTANDVSAMFKNCILANVDALWSGVVAISGGYNGFYNAPVFGDSLSRWQASTSPFVEAVAGHYYLAPSSQFRNKGAPTGLPLSLPVELQQKTTAAPIILSDPVYEDRILTPQARRDLDRLDLGYHYEPLDYCWKALLVGTNVTLILTNGVSVGVFGHAGTHLSPGAKYISEGRPETLNRLTRYTSVQEQPIVPVGGASTGRLLTVARSLPPRPEVHLRFTEVSLLAGRGREVVTVGGGSIVSLLKMSDSLWRGGYMRAVAYVPGMALEFKNNVFENPDITFLHDNQQGYYFFDVGFYNNTVLGGVLNFDRSAAGGLWLANDNLFGAVELTSDAFGPVASANAYHQTISLGGNGNQTIATLDFQNGPLGAYYLPTTGTNLASLINAGSQAATNAGLYHHTATVDQALEGTGLVDIGFHYIPVEPSQSDLVGYWRIDEGTGSTTQDSSGNNRTGSLMNGASWTSIGKIGGAIQLDGADDYIYVYDHSSLRLGTNMTIAFWMRKASEPVDWTRIVGKGGVSDRNYGVWEEPGSGKRLLFQIYNTAGGAHSIFSLTSLNVGEWYHVVATYDKASMKIYINGVLDSSGSATGVPITSSEPLRFGYFASSNRYWPGTLDEVRLYNRTLSASEVMSLANGGVDSDGDGLYDFLEDRDGDNQQDQHETRLDLTDTDGDGVDDYLEWLQGRNPHAGAVGDAGTINLRVYTPLK